MTNKTKFIEDLKNGKLIILDHVKETYPHFEEIHRYTSVASSLTKRISEIKALFNDTEVFDDIHIIQNSSAVNFMYLLYSDLLSEAEQNKLNESLKKIESIRE